MSKIKIFTRVVAVTLILLLAFGLRFKNFAFIPLPGESMDEYSNAWVGLSLIRLGLPVGRSGLVGYHGNDYRYVNVDHFFANTAGGNPLGINKPWFDHPPVLPLITGGYAYLSGARVFEDATARLIRRPMVILGVMTVGLVGVLAYQMGGVFVSLLAMLLFASSPLIVISSRMGQGENLMIIFWLANLVFLKQFLANKSRFWFWLAALAAGMALLSKISGIVAIAGSAAILMRDQKRATKERFFDSALLGLVGLSFLGLFFVYGAALNWKVFLDVWFSNSDRPYDIGFSPLFSLLTDTKITVSKYLTDGWPLIGWLALFSGFSKMVRKQTDFLLSPVVIYLIFFLLMGSSAFGWYRTPFMPFLYIYAGLFLIEGFKQKAPLIQVLLLLIPLGINMGKISELVATLMIKPYWKIGLPALIFFFFVFSLLPEGHQKKYLRIPRIIYLVLICLAIGSNIVFLWWLTPEYWLKVN